jgi:hypothetical protein
LFTGVVHSHAERMVQGLSRVLSESDSDRSELFLSKWNVPQEMGRRKSGLVQGGRGMQLWSVADARLCTQGVVCRVSCWRHFPPLCSCRPISPRWCEVLWLGLRESTESASGIIEMTAARLPNSTVTLVSPGSPRVTPAGHLINFGHATGPELRTAAHNHET